ncbi:hypothetical protein [Polyangium jinanense]|uniref:Type II secretion system protein GspE N-terminal domain-containing protein n=1 Tax=Polyangium jinanense TaxID=2829994 RepID=A0A9X4AWP3_9BACT|nr:hypothetical protein [Polyangium jinanense]MDC3957741.1 hypothetical protein [Polyangium jinanense]MDC3987533.1 hypothetical protein [Polyangium jinanense]
MSVELGRRLIAANLVTREKVQAALLLSVVRGIPFTRALVDRGAITEAELDEEIARYAGPGLRHVQGAPDLVAKLPRAMCRRLCALPTRLDPFTGTVDVAAADPLDTHIESEMSFHLGAPVRVLRAPIGAVEEAIRRIELTAAQPEAPKKPRGRRITPPSPFGAPQSSIPPPPTISTPIPLVKRVPEGGDADPTNAATPATRRGAPGTLRGAAPIERPVRSALPATKAAAAAPASGDDPPRVSFPSTPPPGPASVPSPLAVAPPELTAWRGATRPTLDPSVFSRSPSSDGGTAPRVVGDAASAEKAERAAAMWTTHDAPVSHALAPALGAPIAEPPAGPNSFAPAPSARRGGVSVPPPAMSLPVPVKGQVIAPAPTPAPDSEEEPQRQTFVGPPPLPFPDPSAILGALARAATRDEIVSLALGGAALFARRVALFAVKRDGFHGWTCNEDFGDEEALRALSIPHDVPSVFATATATSIYLGPVPETEAHAGLLAVMERASTDVAVVAVRVAGRPAAVLMVDDLGDTLTGTRRMDELARAVGEALARLLSARG